LWILQGSEVEEKEWEKMRGVKGEEKVTLSAPISLRCLTPDMYQRILIILIVFVHQLAVFSTNQRLRRQRSARRLPKGH